jgi:hypothetical protein
MESKLTDIVFGVEPRDISIQAVTYHLIKIAYLTAVFHPALIFCGNGDNFCANRLRCRSTSEFRTVVLGLAFLYFATTVWVAVFLITGT